MIDDIVKRLRSQHNDLQQNVYYSPAEEPAWDATANAADKIEQLCTVGNALVNYMRESGYGTTIEKLIIAAWEQACDM
jgi:hypothetical protein